MSQEFSKIRVYLLLALGLISFGFAPIMVKFATDYSGLLITTIRTVSAFVMLIPAYLYFRKNNPEQIAGQSGGLLVFFAGVSLGVHFWLWISSLYFTSVASASVLVTIHPIMLVVVERFLFKVRFASTVWIGVFIAFSGSVLLGYSDASAPGMQANPLLGNMMAFLAAIVFVLYFLIGRHIRQQRSWLSYVFPVYGYAALTTVIILLIAEGLPTEIPLPALLVGIGLAIGPQIVGHGSLNYALKFVSPTLLSTLILCEPIFATILAFFFFGEWPVGLALIAITLTLSGVMLSWKKKAKNKR